MTSPGAQSAFGAKEALHAWDQYIAAFESLLTQIAAGVPLHPTVTMPMPALLPWQELLERFGLSPRALPNGGANLAGLGAGREFQESAHRLLQLAQRFRTLYAQYEETIADVHRLATRALGQRLASDATLLNSPSRAYQIWIDGAEAAYARAVHTESFATLFGSMCNLLADFRNERARGLAHMARLWDLPTRSEVELQFSRSRVASRFISRKSNNIGSN